MLTDRQLLILQVIIDDFIRSAQPVGSTSLSKKKVLPLSSATIRNAMADLEEYGFIEKTHTSSGRVPSEKGYRFYVDHMLAPQVPDSAELKKIHSIFQEKIYAFENVVQKSAKILSELTNYTAILLGPAVKDNKLRKLQIVPLTHETAVAIMVTDTGHVENRLFTLPDGIAAHEIEKLVNILNDKLNGVPISDLGETIFKEAASILKQNSSHYDHLIRTLTDAVGSPLGSKVFFGGKSNMLNQPEFHNLDKIRSLMDMIEQEQGIHQLFQHVPNGIHVRIGKENENSVMEDCSLITATYSIGEEPVGSIAILGPTRMEYSRVISLLDFLSKDLSTAITKLYHQ